MVAIFSFLSLGLLYLDMHEYLLLMLFLLFPLRSVMQILFMYFHSVHLRICLLLIFVCIFLRTLELLVPCGSSHTTFASHAPLRDFVSPYIPVLTRISVFALACTSARVLVPTPTILSHSVA
jgi:hypothetical protein